MLVDMVNRRREQEEEAQRLYEIAKSKRKKFKDALLEKALRARAAKEGKCVMYSVLTIYLF